MPSSTVKVNSWCCVPRKAATLRAATKSGDPGRPTLNVCNGCSVSYAFFDSFMCLQVLTHCHFPGLVLHCGYMMLKAWCLWLRVQQDPSCQQLEALHVPSVTSTAAMCHLLQQHQPRSRHCPEQPQVSDCCSCWQKRQAWGGRISFLGQRNQQFMVSTS